MSGWEKAALGQSQSEPTGRVQPPGFKTEIRLEQPLRLAVLNGQVVGSRVSCRIREAGDIAVKSLLNRFGDDLEAVVLFGSSARGEASELSDLDFFVVVQGLPRELLERRRVVYDALTPVAKKFRVSIGVIETDKEELGKTITPLLLNIAHDGVILYDREGNVVSLFERLREALKRAGFVRYRTQDGKYGWKLDRELQPGEVWLIEE
jgi:predicted nucleotidyltransferase